MSDANTVTQTDAAKTQAATDGASTESKTQAAIGEALAGRKRLTGVARFAADFAKHDRIYAANQDDQKDFANFVQTLAVDDTTPGFLDWMEKAPDNFTTLALVRAENGDNRAIAIAAPDVAFANPTVRELLYDLYIGRVLRAARAADAVMEQFIVPDGALKISFDRTAWTFQADDATKQFNAKLEKAKITTKVSAAQLKRCLSDAAFAESIFPNLSDTTWDRILEQLTKNAEAKGYDASIFRHWKIARHLAPEVGDATDETFADFGIVAAPEPKTEPATQSPATVA